MPSFSLFRNLKQLPIAHSCQHSFQDFKTLHSCDKNLLGELVLKVNPDWQIQNGEQWVGITGGIYNLYKHPRQPNAGVLLFRQGIWPIPFSHLLPSPRVYVLRPVLLFYTPFQILIILENSVPSLPFPWKLFLTALNEIGTIVLSLLPRQRPLDPFTKHLLVIGTIIAIWAQETPHNPRP